MNSVKTVNSFTTLPDDLLIEIFSQGNDLNKLCQVCKRWKQAIEEKLLTIIAKVAPSIKLPPNAQPQSILQKIEAFKKTSEKLHEEIPKMPSFSQIDLATILKGVLDPNFS